MRTKLLCLLAALSLQLAACADTQTFAIAIGDTVSDGMPATGAGNIEQPGSVDEYTFVGAESQRVYLDLITAPGNWLRWVVYRPDGTVLWGPQWMYDDPGTLTLPANGTYTIKVYHDADATGPYSFKLNGMRPPVAGDDVAATTQGRVANLPIARLLANDADPDTDPVTLALPSGATAQGGTVAIVGTNVRYTPPGGFHGTDTFTYLADDGWGNSDTATVTVTVRKAEGLGLNTIAAVRNADGSVSLTMAAIPGFSYQLWYAPDVVAGPWTLLTTVTADGNGVVSYVDASAIGVPARFYRLAELP